MHSNFLMSSLGHVSQPFELFKDQVIMKGFCGNLPTEFIFALFLQRRTRERLMNVLTLCGPESGIPKNPSVSLLSYSKASEKVSVKYCHCYTVVSFSFFLPRLIVISFFLHKIYIILYNIYIYSVFFFFLSRLCFHPVRIWNL